MNKIEISGRITKGQVFSHENHGEKFYSTQITSVRTSGVPDTLNVTFSEIFLKNIKEDEHVKIFGEIRTMNYYESLSHLCIRKRRYRVSGKRRKFCGTGRIYLS